MYGDLPLDSLNSYIPNSISNNLDTLIDDARKDLNFRGFNSYSNGKIYDLVTQNIYLEISLNAPRPFIPEFFCDTWEEYISSHLLDSTVKDTYSDLKEDLGFFLVASSNFFDHFEDSFVSGKPNYN